MGFLAQDIRMLWRKIFQFPLKCRKRGSSLVNPCIFIHRVESTRTTGYIDAMLVQSRFFYKTDRNEIYPKLATEHGLAHAPAPGDHHQEEHGTSFLARGPTEPRPFLTNCYKRSVLHKYKT
ncbi:MAG: hypothetical protein RBG13Loki_4285 [Promethearchaeota archaeon CR_4]|nr:MAG: hypothetical protein RBG13Loki_4285 [Candidatus Lokiarchaeota archaeon CR_4]